MKLMARFLVKDDSFIAVFKFLMPLKDSSFNTYSSSLRVFAKTLASLDLDTKIGGSDVISLIAAIRQGNLSRDTIVRVLTFRLMTDEICTRTLNVTVSALKFFWRKLRGEELAPKGSELADTFKGLRKIWDSEVEGCDIFPPKKPWNFLRLHLR